MMENESLMELDVPEFWYEHDENGNRVSLSYIGCFAVMAVGIAVAHRIYGLIAKELALPKRTSTSLDNIDIDEVTK